MTIAVVGAPNGLGGRLAAALSATSLSFDPVPDGEYSGLVVVVGADPGPSPGPLTAIDAGAWRREAEAVPLRAMHILQRAHALMARRGGRIVVVTPTIGASRRGEPGGLPHRHRSRQGDGEIGCTPMGC